MGKDIEQLVADILLPRTHFRDVLNNTNEFELVYGSKFEDYTLAVEKFAGARKRNYDSFRDFLDKYSEAYLTPDICNLTNKEIDSIFDMILNYQAEAILEKCGLESDEESGEE